MHDDVSKWKARLRRKGPFFLLRTESLKNTDGTRYVVIWNDGTKTKIGALHDHMYVRYGIATRAVLNGDRPHDLWNGSTVSDEEFAAMLLVRQGQSPLQHFNLDQLQHLKH